MKQRYLISSLLAFLCLLFTLPTLIAQTITGINPSTGSVGTLVTVSGTGLSNPTAFSIGGKPAIVISNNGTSLVGMVMPGAVNGSVSVTTSGSAVSSATAFTVTPTIPPVVQQGSKLVGTGNVGAAFQGRKIAVSADGNTAIVGTQSDNGNQGAAWIWVRSGGVWTQQGNKLVGIGNVGNALQGSSVSISANGNTALVGGYLDNGNRGAAWVFTRTGTTWTQQGAKLTGTGAIGFALMGFSASLSADGNTAILGGYNDNASQGAAWVFTRVGSTWTQQGNKLVGTGNVGNAFQGYSVALSADGNNAIVGGYLDNGNQGAIWAFARNGATWSQQGSKIVGTGTVTTSRQGTSVALSADASTAIVGAPGDASPGTALIFTRSGNTWSQQGSKLIVTGNINAASIGNAVSISADGNMALIAGQSDNANLGATWVFTRTGSTWFQLGNKLVGSGSVGTIVQQGAAIGLSADGTTALIGGFQDNSNQGAAWAFTIGSPDASLSALSSAAGTLTTAFATGTTAYTISGASTDITTVTATSTHANATLEVQVNNEDYLDISSGNASTNLVMSALTNTIDIIVAAEDRVTTKSYRITVNRQKPSAPTITGISPLSGPVGSLVTITGTDLGSITDLKVAGVSAIPVSNTGIALVAMVMPGAVSGAASIATLGGGPVSSTGIFTVTPSVAPSLQQGAKLVGTGAVAIPRQAFSSDISADGNTAIVGGYQDNSNQGAVWIWVRNGGTWTQQGSKLVGAGNSGIALQGYSVALSADGNTAIVGGFNDNGSRGAAWIWTRNGETWSQQGTKLVGAGSSGLPGQGYSVNLSADGNTAIVGGYNDNSGQGAVWIWVRTAGTWRQQGDKLVATGNVGAARQGNSIGLSADGNTAIIGAYLDNSNQGASWIWTRNGGVWTQQGDKLVGTGNTGIARQGTSVAISADGNTAIASGTLDNANNGASWIWVRNGGTWAQQGNKLVGAGNTGAAQQGISVSISADGNTAIIGGQADNASQGASWIWARSGAAWTQQGSKIVGSGGGIGVSQRGSSVAISADASTAFQGGQNDNLTQGAAWAFFQAQKGQTVIFAALPSKIYGSADFDAGASNTSSLAVSYSSDNAAVATIVAGKIHIVGAGTATITASQAGDAAYMAATDVNQVLTVTQAPLTITAVDKTKIYGQADPVFTANYSGFVNGDTNSSLTTQPAVTTTATLTSIPGDYPIIPSGAVSSNYAFTYVNAVLRVFGHPTNIILTQGTLYENRPAGTQAATLASESPDPNATYTYSLVSGTGSTDNALFAISGSNVVTAVSLNFEQKAVYSVLVRSTTQYGFFLDKALTITISDVNEVPTMDVVANQIICYSPGAKTIALSGITGGPETSQTAIVTVTSSNAALMTQLAVTGNGTTRTIGYVPTTANGGTTTLTVTVRDNGGTANGGTDTFVRTFSVTINPLPVITLSSSLGTVISKGVTTQLIASGGATYTWANTAGIVSGQNSPVLTVRPAVNTTYTVTVTSAAGCVSVQSINLQVMEDYKALNGANILTPNGDGKNDFLVIKNIDFYPNNILKIFDTAGRLLHEKKGYTNDWGGTYQGVPLVEGTYFYILDFGNRSNTQRGFVSIVY